MNFLYENNLRKILKAKDQLQLGSQVMIQHLAILSLPGPCEGLRLSKLNSADH